MHRQLGSLFVMAALLLFVASLSAGCAPATSTSDSTVSGPSETPNPSRVVEVDGRQGVAAENGCFWVSGSTALSKYDGDWNLVAVNEAPFEKGYKLEVNHIGDIDVYDNEVYCGVERFVDGVASNIQIAVYDGDTLELKRTFNFDQGSGQDECSGICVNPDAGTVSMCAWTDTGDHVYNYDLKTGEYLGKVRLSPAPKWIQGIAYHQGAYYLTSDDGDANDDAPDHVYRFELVDGASEAKVELAKTLEDVRRQGEVEGLSFDEDSGELLVLHNRGAVIEQGMPVGFYDGYDHEIHEVYVYGAGS
ncbi:MAG: hypothetical protein Q4A01_03480 [Coriobacteriales bacterium]|nr:hypothetical protein [Coriobacteriales bacterium]